MMPRRIVTLFVMLLAGLLTAERSSGQPQSIPATTVYSAPVFAQEPNPSGQRLILMNTGSLAGQLQPADRPGVVRWQCQPFLEPLEFPVQAVSSVQFPGTSHGVPRDTDYCFELSGGDILFGSLLSLNAETLEIDSRHTGRLRLPRAQLSRIVSLREGQDLVYLGPNGLAEWSASPKSNAWRDESGHLVCDVPWSSIYADLGIPGRAYVELELSWKVNPDFMLAVGSGSDASASAARGFCFEFWNRNLVVARETERRADLAPLGSFDNGPGRLKLWVFLDQTQGMVVVTSESGKKLATLNAGADEGKVLPGVHLVNKRGDVRLERLRIGKWSGEFPDDGRLATARVHQSDGRIVYGQVNAFDADSRQFVVSGDGNAEVRLDEKDVSSVFLTFAGDDAPRDVRATYFDGSRLSGGLEKIDEDALWLRVPGANEPWRLPLKDLNSLVSASNGTPPNPPQIGQLNSSGRLGMLELLPYANLPGYLVDGQNDEEGSCLVFRPDGALAAGRLRHSASGSITYGYRQQMQRVPSVRSVQPSVLSGFLRAFSGSGREAGGGASMLRMMHLRSGDTVPCEVLRIDDEGVHFQSDVTQSTVVPHEEIKAIVLANTAAESAVTDEKWRRLLTVPRMQKGNEPTHLICAKSGDFLRGRLVGMDDETLQLETRLETIAIPRFRVAQIIWLHMDELESGTLEKDPPSPDTVGANQKMRIQAVRADSNRLTFYPERVRDSLIDGHSPVLGACRVSVVEAETILLGSAIRAAAADLRFSQFVLRPATDPRFVTAEGQSSAESGEPGMQSPLVGTPAPEFRLDLLDGTSFQLSEHRGRVIVLDFWASWCGPCIQAMPEVDSIAGSFEDQGVRLVAVNLQETPDRINAALERLQLDTTVALDRDGAIAARYRATAIPQTVIIDRQGNIARLFVGGGREFPELFRAALETVVAQP